MPQLYWHDVPNILFLEIDKPTAIIVIIVIFVIIIIIIIILLV